MDSATAAGFISVISQGRLSAGPRMSETKPPISQGIVNKGGGVPVDTPPTHLSTSTSSALHSPNRAPVLESREDVESMVNRKMKDEGLKNKGCKCVEDGSNLEPKFLRKSLAV